MTGTTTTEATRERYIELAALNTALTSGYALGEVLDPLLTTLSLDDPVLDFKPTDGPGYCELFCAVLPEDLEETSEGLLIHARTELLTARLLRSITPEVVEEGAAYFEHLAAQHLARASELMGAVDA